MRTAQTAVMASRHPSTSSSMFRRWAPVGFGAAEAPCTLDLRFICHTPPYLAISMGIALVRTGHWAARWSSHWA